MKICNIRVILTFVLLINIIIPTFAFDSETQSQNISFEQSLTVMKQTNFSISTDSHEESNKEETNQESDAAQTEQKKEQNHDQHADPHHSKIPGVGLSIVFIFGSLLYGSVLKLFSRWSGIPYNPLLLLSGILLGLYYKHLGIIGMATELVSQVNPNVILAIFLPCLIFESAFKTEWHTFKKLAGQSLIIGVLSSIVCASLIMVIVKLVIDSHAIYSWQEALMLGSMLTCTDILSFVHKLKRNGTPQKLTSLIQGESLFNYCTCVLIFQFMQYFAEVKQKVDPWDYLKLFIEQVFGGILFGVVMGVIAVYCIKRMIYDGILVVTLMFIFTYAIYLTAQYSKLRISGIISLAVFGLYMNAHGKTWLFGQTQQFVSSFWSYLVFVAETCIFLIAGVLVGANLIHFQSGDIDINEEYIVMVYIYIAALISRFVSIGAFYRFLKRFGQGLNLKQIIILTFAGLKGAIGIALAMHVFKNQHYGKIVSSLIMIHVTTNSLITLFIHGMTIGYAIKWLGISSVKRVEYKFFQQYLYSFQASIIQKKQKLRQEKSQGYEMIQWQQVQDQIGLKTYAQMITTTQRLIQQKNYVEDSKFQKSQMFKLQNALRDYIPIHTAEYDSIAFQKNASFDLSVEYRKRFLKDLISKYWQFHQNNFTTPAALMLLIQSANSDLDKQTQQIESWNWIKNQISFNMRIFSELMKLTLINQLAKSHLFQYVSFCYDVVSSYIKANEQVREELQDFYNKSDSKNKQEQCHILRNILKESQENQKEAEFFLINYLEPSFPEIQRQVKTRKVSFFILHTFKGIIDKNNENGQLEPNQFDMLNHIIDSKSLELNLFSPKWEETSLFAILKQTQLFKVIPEPILQLISDQLGQQYTYDANERVMDNAEIAKYFYFVKKGGCIVEFTNQNMVYKQPMLAGQVFGFQSLLTNVYHSKATANTMAEIVQIKKSLMLKIFDVFPQFQVLFWKKHIFQCYKMFVKKDDITYSISHVHKEQLQEMISHFKFERIEPAEIEVANYDMIFIRGQVQIWGKDQGSAVKSDKKNKQSERMSLHSNSYELATPFFFISRNQQAVIRIKEPSYFLIGELDYTMFERISTRMSRGIKSWKEKKKSSLVK